MRTVYALGGALLCAVHTALADSPSRNLAQIASRYGFPADADVAVAKSVIDPGVLRGEVGEAVRNRLVATYPHRSGAWLDISPRLGRQGLDHVSIQLDSNGSPRRIMVDETKFGSAQLGRTAGGDIQMGERWTSKRLQGLAMRYQEIGRQGRSGELRQARVPSSVPARRVMQVPLSETESVRFWRPTGSAGPWCYDGPAETLPRAVRQTERLGAFIDEASNGRVNVLKRIVQVKLGDGRFVATIRDARLVDATGGQLAALPLRASEIVIPGGAAADAAILERQITAEIHRQMPYLDPRDARQMAAGVRRSASSLEEVLSRRSFTNEVARRAGGTAAVAMMFALPVDIAMQMLAGGERDWARTAGITGLAGGSGFAGAALGHATAYALLRTPSGYSMSQRLAEATGLRSPLRVANLGGGLAGGASATLLFAYGGYWLGYYDLQSANRAALAGGIGFGAGALFSATTMALISAYGTAGTGVAISSISGVAATNASLAWLGAGTLAAGGTGVVGGTILLATGVGTVVVITSGGVLYAMHLWDEHQEDVRLRLMLDYLSGEHTFSAASGES